MSHRPGIPYTPSQLERKRQEWRSHRDLGCRLGEKNCFPPAGLRRHFGLLMGFLRGGNLDDFLETWDLKRLLSEKKT